MLVIPEATASSITYWMIGLSTRGSISLGCALVAGRKRVPRPAAGKTAFRIFFMTAGNATTRLREAIPGHATLNDHARPQVRGGEPRASPGGAPEPGPDPRGGAAGRHPEGRAAPACTSAEEPGDWSPGEGDETARSPASHRRSSEARGGDQAA